MSKSSARNFVWRKPFSTLSDGDSRWPSLRVLTLETANLVWQGQNLGPVRGHFQHADQAWRGTVDPGHDSTTAQVLIHNPVMADRTPDHRGSASMLTSTARLVQCILITISSSATSSLITVEVPDLQWFDFLPAAYVQTPFMNVWVASPQPRGLIHLDVLAPHRGPTYASLRSEHMDQRWLRPLDS